MNLSALLYRKLRITKYVIIFILSKNIAKMGTRLGVD